MSSNKQPGLPTEVSYNEAAEASKKYFDGDDLAATVWVSKYALKDSYGHIYEKTPRDMHERIAAEIERIEKKYPNPMNRQEVFELLDHFRYIIPQGGPMTGIGNNFQAASLSNCFVIGHKNPADSYGGIFRMDEEQVQLMKRRGGVGHDLSHIRPSGSPVLNSALTSTGIVPFMERYSNSTREVAQDGRRGALMLCVSIKHPDPRFEGQTKTKLDNPDAAKACSKVTNDEIIRFFDRNLETLKKVIGCAEKAAKIRKTEERAKTNLLTKQKYSFDRNGKLANCESRDASKCEIFIVEGDSAGGSAKTARDSMFQAILPIRGKILNVEKASIDKVLANAEIKTMINAFGCGFSEGYGNDFDITKLRYDKIIIMADADVDGAHISTLLLTLFYRFMPELIYEGHVYIAMPPLYKVIPSKGEEEYLYDDKALEKYRKTHTGSFTLQRYKGLGEMDAQQLWETTLDPKTRILKRVEIEDARMASDVTEVLMGTDVPPRKAFIYQHAQNAQLDI